MALEFMLRNFADNPQNEAMIWNDHIYDYGWLLAKFKEWMDKIAADSIEPGSVTAIEGDFSPNSVALLLALIESNCVVIPLTSSVAAQREEFLEISQTEIVFQIGKEDEIVIERYGRKASHPFYQKLREAGHPGLVLFSSGSTGKSKAAVHDFLPIIEKFKVPRHSMRSISFLLYDHIGGVNTLLYTLSNSGCIVTVKERTPDEVLKTVEKYKVELLPTSPTFLNLILISEASTRYDCSSLKTITYGTEPMPESTLKRVHQTFPHTKLLQTYGLSELGILRSKSKASDSLWVKVGGEGFETRIVDGILEIKAQSAMMGYLNAASPFTEDGWFHTGDMVETDGEYLKILGRETDIINVGGEKVYPAEVENVIQEFDNVAEVAVFSEKNPITGNIVCAKVTPKSRTNDKEFKRSLLSHCRERLNNYKVPVKVLIVYEKQYSERFKKKKVIP